MKVSSVEHNICSLFPSSCWLERRKKKTFAQHFLCSFFFVSARLARYPLVSAAGSNYLIRRITLIQKSPPAFVRIPWKDPPPPPVRATCPLIELARRPDDDDGSTAAQEKHEKINNNNNVMCTSSSAGTRTIYKTQRTTRSNPGRCFRVGDGYLALATVAVLLIRRRRRPVCK